MPYIDIDCFYILHYDSYYQYRSDNIKNIVNVNLDNYEYNICKCFNNIKFDSKVWIIWDSTFFFNCDKKYDFEKNLKYIEHSYKNTYYFFSRKQ